MIRFVVSLGSTLFLRTFFYKIVIKESKISEFNPIQTGLFWSQLEDSSSCLKEFFWGGRGMG